MIVLAICFAALALAGCGQALAARRALRRLAAQPVPTGPAGSALSAASILKPLHGADPALARNLAATLGQRHAAPFEVLCAVADPADPARHIAEAALAASATPSRLLVGGAVLGPNRKVSQLIHLAEVARHPVLVIADADMDCPPHWLCAVAAPLTDPSCGLVTCLYRGVPGDASPWSRLAALGVDWHFLPNAALGEALGKAEGCYGATMALRAETLARIGGFAPLLDVLADDHALGAAVRRLGLRVEVSPVLPGHVMSEASLASLWSHELRWARTVRLLNPRGFLGLGLTHPLPWAILALLCAPGLATLGLLALVLAARAALASGVDAAIGASGGLRRLAWLPIRDLLSAAIWFTALRHGGVDWQGRRYALSAGGRMSEATPARSGPP